MNDLTTLLDAAAGPATAPLDVHSDLRRGHRALARTRARRGAAGLVGVAAVGVLGAGLSWGRDQDGTPVASDPTTSVAPTVAPTPTADPITEGFFVFGSVPPEGWTIQGSDGGSVTWARAGDTTSPREYGGKIVVMVDINDPAGQPQDVDGRTFWVSHDHGYTRMSTRTRGQEPTAVLSVQFPTAIDWPTADAVAFLNDVQVLDGAQPSAG